MDVNYTLEYFSNWNFKPIDSFPKVCKDNMLYITPNCLVRVKGVEVSAQQSIFIFQLEVNFSNLETSLVDTDTTCTLPNDDSRYIT